MKIGKEKDGRWVVTTDGGEEIASFDPGIYGYEAAARYMHHNAGSDRERADSILQSLKSAEYTLESLYERYLHNSTDGEDAWEALDGDRILRDIRAAIKKWSEK